MEPESIILLPGLDGSDRLLGRFCELGPTDRQVQVYPLPDDSGAGYNELCDHFSERIEGRGRCHLIAESFSGPLGILLAHRHPDVIFRLTLVATFAVSPMPAVARLVPWSVLFRLPVPSWIVSQYFAGPDRPLIREFKRGLRSTSVPALVGRMHTLMNVNVTGSLSELTCSVDYLRATRDRLVGKPCLDRIMAANPAVEVHEIDGPHLVLQTRPEASWQAILAGRLGLNSESRRLKS